MKKLLVILLTIPLLGLIGCGSNDEKAELATLTPQEKVIVANFNLDVANTVLDGSGYGKLLSSVDEVIALSRKKPDAIYDAKSGQRTMRQVLADASAHLSQYQPSIAKQLELALESLPASK